MSEYQFKSFKDSQKAAKFDSMQTDDGGKSQFHRSTKIVLFKGLYTITRLNIGEAIQTYKSGRIIKTNERLLKAAQDHDLQQMRAASISR